MGFCRRCGDIVSGLRCKCGGTPVAPVVQWNPTGTAEERQDRWSQTYTRDNVPVPVRSRSRGPPSTTPADQGAASPPAVKRFPRPKSAASSPILGSKVSAHIAATTSYRSTSPLKLTNDSHEPIAADILVSPDTFELSKVYGSVLQPKETLATFCCHICSAPFPPDATIYPDPAAPSLSADSGRFLCRPCFVSNGGSKGDCHVCYRPVLILKREGGFVEASGRVYHKQCFRCEGCLKNIGDKPMVDLLGRPSCVDCFDTCLSRRESPRKPPHTPDASRTEKRGYLGGATGASNRQSSPALEELEQRLGILRTKESSSAVTGPIGTGRTRVYSDARPEDDSPAPRAYTRFQSAEPETRTPSRGRGSLPSAGKPTGDAIEEMKRRFLRPSLSSPDTSPTKSDASLPETPPSKIPTAIRGGTSPYLRSRRSNPSLADSIRNTPAVADAPLSPEPPISRIPTAGLSPRRSFDSRLKTSMSATTTDAERVQYTPDLVSDFSDSLTQSSGVTTPPTMSPPAHRTPKAYTPSTTSKALQHTPTKPRTSDTTAPTQTFHSKRSLENLRIPAPLSPESRCTRCDIPLFTTNGGKFVTVPEEPSAAGAQPKVYHSDCFRCWVCDETFAAGDKGQAVFVRAEGGPCHLECAPPEKVKTRPASKSLSTQTPYKRNTFPAAATALSSSASTSSASVSRYEPSPHTAGGSTTAFPRFGNSNSCPGCFKAVSPMERGVVPGPQGTRWHSSCLVCGGQDAKRRSRRADDGKPGCGKKLDSAAKSDSEGGVWCRDCLMLLPSATRSPSSAGRSPLITSTSTGGGSFWSTRGNTAPVAGRVAQQFTGATTIARQQTGLGLVSPPSDPAILGQLTGGGLSPTRQLGMTGLAKQFTGNGAVRSHTTGGGGVSTHFTGGSVVRPNMTGNSQARSYARPKSSAGFHTAKSVDEGRGMFLVRQMTGGQGTFSGASEYSD